MSRLPFVLREAVTLAVLIAFFLALFHGIAVMHPESFR